MADQLPGEETRTAPPPESPAPPPQAPTREPPLRRLLRGALTGLIVGAITGALVGGGFALFATRIVVGRNPHPLPVQDIVSYVLDRVVRFGILGAVLVGISVLIFGGWKRPDRPSKP